MTDKRLKSIADRIEKLMDERDGIQADIRDVYAEAKSAGYVPKVLRKAITRKRMDPSKRDEEDTILDLYEDALSPSMRRAVEMAKGGATSRQIEDETGIDHATVARSVALNKKSETPDAAPGARVDDGAALTTAAAPPSVVPRLATPQAAGGPVSAVEPVPDGGVGTGTHSDEAPATPSVGAVASESERVASSYTDDDLTIPEFLRGASPANRSLRA